MKRKFRRIIGAICALALCASMIPASALADPVVADSGTAVIEQTEEEQPTEADLSSAEENQNAAEDSSAPEAEVTENENADSEDVAAEDPDAAAEETDKDAAAEETDKEAAAEADSQAAEAEDSSDSEPAEEPADSTPAAEEEPADNSQPEASTFSLAPEEDATDRAGGAETYASHSVTVVQGQTITYYGSGDGFFVEHDWEIVSGSANVRISYDGNAVEITGLQAGTARLRHTYRIPFWGTYTETVEVTVTRKASSSKPVYLFVAKPGNTTLSNNGSDYYYLARGGSVSGIATHSSFVKDTTNEEAVTQYVDTWPTELDFLSGTSSTSVGRSSTWEIDADTGEITSFSLWLGNEHYTSENYGLRWAKFSYANTNWYGNQYHVDAILYAKQTVNNVIVSELNAKKLLTAFSLNEEGTEKTSETFQFSIVDLNDDNTVKGNVNIPLTATVDRLNQAVSLDAGEHGKDVLAPGRYRLSETQQADDPVWETANSVIFEIYTNGEVNVVSGGSKGSITITNTPKTYTLSYDLNGGSGTISGQSGLKYNAKTTVTDEKPTNPGNVFLGWSTTKNGNVAYKAGAELQIKGNVTLYAVWGPVSVSKSVVLSNSSVDSVVSKDDYASVISSGSGYVTYTVDGTAKLLYKVTVNAYQGAEITITDTPQGGTASYVAAAGATTSDNKNFTMTASTANIYYEVEVTGVADQTVVNNQVSWTLATQSGTDSAEPVTVVKTDKTVKVEKSIAKVERGDVTIESATDDTVLKVGDKVTWQIKVTNTGKVALDNLQISDTLHAAGTLPTTAELKVQNGQAQSLTCTWSEGTNGNHTVTWTVGALDVNEVATITYTYTIAEEDASAAGSKDLSNTAVPVGAKADDDSDTGTQNFVEKPALSVTKSGSAQVSEDGNMQIAYTVSVTNDGNAPLTSLTLEDSKFASPVTVKNDGTEVAAGKIQLSGSTLAISDTLAIGKTLTVEYVYDVVETPEADGSLVVSNQVDVTGTTANNNTATGSASADTQVYSGTVTVALAPIVIYTGGDGTTQAIVGEDGRPVASDDSGLPTFGVTMTLPNQENVAVDGDAVAAELYDITSQSGARAGYHWSAVSYNDNATVLMQLMPEGTTTPVRIQLTDSQGKVVTSDEFSVGNALCQSYTTELYVAELKTTTIIAEVDGKFYQIAYEPSTLTVRGTTPDAQTTPVIDSADQISADATLPQAVLPADTSYYYVSGNDDNSGTLKVGDTSSVSLLVDEIVDQSVATDQQYVQMMKDKAEADDSLLGAVPADTARVWRFYYMDLVLANNGNAVLTADKDVEIYWPYPDGVTYQDVVDGKYSFTVLHYVGLDRNYASDAFASELQNCRVAQYKVTATSQGLCFTVPSADGFSPYALVYEYSTKGPEQSTTVTATPTPDEHPDIADAKANGTWGQPTPTPAGSTVIPQTSDDMPLTALIVVAVAAAAALIVLVVVRRRRKQ